METIYTSRVCFWLSLPSLPCLLVSDELGRIPLRERALKAIQLCFLKDDIFKLVSYDLSTTRIFVSMQQNAPFFIRKGYDALKHLGLGSISHT